MTTCACAYDGCEKPARSLGLCWGHYDQVHRGAELRPLLARRPGHLAVPILSVEIIEDSTRFFMTLEDDELLAMIAFSAPRTRCIRGPSQRDHLLAALAAEGLRPVIREDIAGGLCVESRGVRDGIARIAMACTRVGVPQP